MTAPDILREGDTWSIVWQDHGVSMGIDHVRDSSDGIKAEITIESQIAGRVHGPVVLNLLSTRSQTELANRCFKRVNALSANVWDSLIMYACAVVAKQYRAPSPTINLAEVPDPGPVRFLIPQLVPLNETTVLFGDGASAKSLLCLQIALCVSLGHDLPWGARPESAHVLYLDWETNYTTVAARLARLVVGSNCEMPTLYYRQCFRSLADELPDIREQIARRQIGLVIVDSIGFAASGSLVEDETARSAMNGLRQLSPATRLVIAHVSKATADATSPGKPFGSQFFWNGMRSGIEVRRSEDQDSDRMIDLALFHRKVNDGVRARPIGLSAVFDGSAGMIRFVPADLAEIPDLATRTPLSNRIRSMLRNGSQSTHDLAQELDVKEDTIRQALGRMQGVVRLEEGGGRGKPTIWGLTE